MSNRTRITFQCSTELREAIEAYSDDRELTVSAAIVSALRDFMISEGYLKSPKKPKTPVTMK